MNYLIKFQKEFNCSNIVASYLKLCEIFVFLCEEKQYLDSNLCDMILNFKNDYIKNYKSRNFLFLKSASIDNKENLSKELLEIIKLTTLKTQEL